MPEQTEPVFASIGDRLVAQLVDGLVAFGLFFFVGMTLAPRFGGATRTGFDMTGWPAAVVLTVVGIVLLAYFVLAEGSLGATLGKAVAEIRVQTPAGARIGLRAALVRNLMRLIDGLGVYLVGAIAILATRRNQRLGDLAAGCIVVRSPFGRGARVAALIVALVLAAGGVAGGFVLRPTGGPAAEQAQPEQAPAAKAPAGQPRLATVVVTDDRESKTERTIFSLDAEKIYVVFTLADVPEDTSVKALWIAERVEGYPADHKFGEKEVTAGGKLDEGHFSLSRPDDGWLTGAYRVELYLADQLVRTVRFSIKGE